MVRWPRFPSEWSVVPRFPSECSVESLDFGHFPVLTGEVRHRWARFLRAGSDYDGKPTNTLREYPEAGPGRFKITAMTPDKWIRFNRCARTVMGEDGEASCWIREGHSGPCQPWTPMAPADALALAAIRVAPVP